VGDNTQGAETRLRSKARQKAVAMPIDGGYQPCMDSQMSKSRLDGTTQGEIMIRGNSV